MNVDPLHRLLAIVVVVRIVGTIESVPPPAPLWRVVRPKSSSPTCWNCARLRHKTVRTSCGTDPLRDRASRRYIPGQLSGAISMLSPDYVIIVVALHHRFHFPLLLYHLIVSPRQPRHIPSISPIPRCIDPRERFARCGASERVQ